MRTAESALQYAERGLLVFPVFEPRDGVCSCKRGRNCPKPSKHPRTPRGWKDATTDHAQVSQWWSQWPEANLGIATGPSRLVVLDCDPRHGGDESLRDLQATIGRDAFETVSWLTPSGGQHYVFRAPSSYVVHSSEGKLGPGLDVRADGGFAVAPPSRGIRGDYVHDAAQTWGEYPMRPWPDALTDLLRAHDRNRPTVRAEAKAGVSHVPGDRNTFLLRYCSALRGLGHPEDFILSAARTHNASYLRPPLSDDEVQHIVASSGRYGGLNPSEWLKYWLPQLSPSEAKLAAFLAALHMQVGDRVTPAASVIMRGTGLSRPSVFLLRDKLEKRGAIHVTHRGREAAEIRLALDHIYRSTDLRIENIWSRPLDYMTPYSNPLGNPEGSALAFRESA